MGLIKAIETVYMGYRFRSRTEARYAVFFDALGIKWEYEKEGYDLGASGLYLPDFWLSEQECFIEIKGVPPTDAEIKKCRELFAMTGFAVFVFWGTPGDFLYGKGWYDSVSDRGGGNTSSNYCSFFCCTGCNKVFIEDVSNVCDSVGNNRYVGRMSSVWKQTSCYCGDVEYGEKAIKHAIDAARSARFEHGENGTGARPRAAARSRQRRKK